MHGNVTTAAWIFGGALVLASAMLVLGIYFTVMLALDHAEASAQQHAAAVERAGTTVSHAIDQSVDNVAAAFRDDVVAAIEAHGEAVTSAGTTVGRAFEKPLRVSVNTPTDAPLSVQLAQPLEIEQPIVVEGTIGEDRSVPVNIFE